MRLVSWNVHRCIGTDRRYLPERILEVLVGLNADLIALQEIDSSLRTSTGIDQLTYLAAELKMQAVMGPTLHHDYGSYGNAMLTRGQILSVEEHDLSFRKFEPRGALAMQLRLKDGDLRIVNTHLGLKYWERSFQIDRLLADFVWKGVDPATFPVVVLGDFNEWFPFSGNNLRLQWAFSSQSPRMPTFPSGWPRFALDRIFLSGPVAPSKFEVLGRGQVRGASDHLPLIGDIIRA